MAGKIRTYAPRPCSCEVHVLSRLRAHQRKNAKAEVKIIRACQEFITPPGRYMTSLR